MNLVDVMVPMLGIEVWIQLARGSVAALVWGGVTCGERERLVRGGGFDRQMYSLKIVTGLT